VVLVFPRAEPSVVDTVLALHRVEHVGFDLLKLAMQASAGRVTFSTAPCKSIWFGDICVSRPCSLAE
jgi:hypothetical protein